jgi:hypothetical protein
MMYRIRNWDEYFEKAESRRVKTMSWVPIPTKHDGSGFRRIALHERSVELYCAWMLIVQVAAKMPTRGLLFKDGKALTARDLHYRTGYPEEIFHLAFTVLVENDIGWLERVAGDGTDENQESTEAFEEGAHETHVFEP